MMLVRAMEGGLHLDAVAPQNLSELFPINHKYHFVAMAPLQAEKLTQQLGSTWTSSFQHILLGGTGLSESQQTMFAQLPAEKMWMGFGMTETSSHIALQSLSNLSKGFQLLPGIEARTNEEGCLQVRGAITENKWLSTNDLVELKSNHLTFLGRIDDQINSGGVKISPVQVEKMILANLEKRSIPSFEFAVSSVKDDSLGEALVFVSQQKLAFKLKDVNVGLPTYHNLKKSYVVKNFPLNEQGKLNRKQLKIILESCHPTTP
jgi:O-succinylbenzoic acid--CoA ligase